MAVCPFQTWRHQGWSSTWSHRVVYVGNLHDEEGVEQEELPIHPVRAAA